jgi:hypothetical protein
MCVCLRGLVAGSGEQTITYLLYHHLAQHASFTCGFLDVCARVLLRARVMALYIYIYIYVCVIYLYVK